MNVSGLLLYPARPLWSVKFCFTIVPRLSYVVCQGFCFTTLHRLSFIAHQCPYHVCPLWSIKIFVLLLYPFYPLWYIKIFVLLLYPVCHLLPVKVSVFHFLESPSIEFSHDVRGELKIAMPNANVASIHHSVPIYLIGY